MENSPRIKNGTDRHGAEGGRDLRIALQRFERFLLSCADPWNRDQELRWHNDAQRRIDTRPGIFFWRRISPWQTRSNENTNGLRAAVLPKRY